MPISWIGKICKECYSAKIVGLLSISWQNYVKSKGFIIFLFKDGHYFYWTCFRKRWPILSYWKNVLQMGKKSIFHWDFRMYNLDISQNITNLNWYLATTHKNLQLEFLIYFGILKDFHSTPMVFLKFDFI